LNGTVLIAGIGLIGGSLALAIKDAHPHATVIGYDIKPSERKLAKALGVVDEESDSFIELAARADLIILAVPVKQTEILIEELVQHANKLKENVIVTDTGSTKAKIMQKGRKLNHCGVSFIGGHPMAGSHKSGVAAAKKILFENAFYLLTPDEKTSPKELNTLKEWLKGTKAKMIEVSPEEHDQLTGVISHFPHVIASSLVHQARRFDEQNPLVSRLAAGGFRDITRIASSNPEMWKDVSLHNKETLIRLLESWQKEMQKFASMLKSENAEELYNYFAAAKSFRDQLPSSSKGAIPSFYDLYVDVPDYPGVISEITGYLAQERISITNIRIMETREDVYGVLVISFQNDDDREKAKDCIQRHTNYDVFLA
jgi:prephenate dehydrogenase